MSDLRLTLHAIEQQFDTVLVLLARDIRIRYKGSAIGVLWAVLSPLATVAVLHFVFKTMFPLAVPHFALFLYLGLWPWTWMSASLDSSAMTLLDNRDLVRTPFFRHAILPAIAVGTNFVLFLCALPVLLGFMLGEGVPASPMLLVLPLVWVCLGLFTLALSVVFAALSVVVRDIKHLLSVLLLLWFYATPIFYEVDRIPASVRGWLTVNPMTAFVEAHRAVVLRQQMPDWPVLGSWALGSLLVLWIAVHFYRVLQDQFIEAS